MVMDEFWQRAAVAGGVILLTLVAARLVDRVLGRRFDVRPETRTRYRVVRHSAVVTILTVGALSALLVLPPVRAIAGTILASSAVIALVVGFAAQSTLSNFVAGLLIAFTQPLRLGDAVEVGAASGIVEEIGLMYTVIRSPDAGSFFVPNSKLASDTIRNETLAPARADASDGAPGA
jgi:small conductance mechanosensitive channel